MSDSRETDKPDVATVWIKSLIGAYRLPRRRDDVKVVRFGLADPEGNDPALSAAWLNAAKVMGEVWKNEETRFNNITSRGATMLAATSVLSTILGFTSKQVVDSTLAGNAGDTAKWASVIALALLGITILVLVFGVLVPRGRFVFGNNQLVGMDGTVGSPLTTSQIDQVAAIEYGGMYVALANRSRRKAYWLNVGYTLFGVGVVVGLFGVVEVIVATNPQ